MTKRKNETDVEHTLRKRSKDQEYQALHKVEARERSRVYYYSHLEERRALGRVYNRSHREGANSRVRKWYEQHGRDVEVLLRSAAGHAVSRAVSSGFLVPPLYCEGCGKIPDPVRDGRRAIQAHHYLGYNPAYWLDVKWFCQVCHEQEGEEH